ncbi:MAG: YbaK/EbsC family protein [Tepidisphaeraceae bacterium]
MPTANWYCVPCPRAVGSIRPRSRTCSARDVHLADESAMRQVFQDCELGAEPPIGRLFGLRTLMDETLGDKPALTFQAGTHCDAVTVSLRDFVKLTDPVVGHITYGEV